MTGLATVVTREQRLAAFDNYIDGMSPYALQEWAPGLIPKWSRYIPHTPTDRQWAFLLLDCREALYGGAVGGGKSDALLMAALQYVDVPGYAALLLRRSYMDLEKPGALIPRSHEWLNGTDAHWRGDIKQWQFPNHAVLDFGYLDHDNHLYAYQGGAWQFVGWDELTQFQENWYRYLFSRTRRLKTNQFDIPIRIRSASNPSLSIQEEWVKQRFLVEGLSHGRVFIPAILEDNPHLDTEEYDKSLAELDPTTRAQLRHGRWDMRKPGQFFQRHWFKVVPQAPAGCRPIRMWDLAATKSQSSAYTAGALISINAGRLTIHHMRRIKGDPGEVEATIRQQAQLDGRAIPIHMEQEGGSGGINTTYRYRHTVLSGWAFHEYIPKHDKLTRASPFAALARGGGVEIVEGDWNSAYLDEVETFPNGFKDQVDTCSAALQVLTQRPEARLTAL